MKITTSSASKTSAAESPVWRYLDFAKFIDLLQTSELHFTRLDRLQDPFEHALSRARAYKDRRKFGLRVEYVNCWFQSQFESAAMWSIYATAGIAIRSGLDRLTGILPEVSQRLQGFEIGELAFGSINYLDEDEIAAQLQDPNRRDGLTFAKRKSFSYEQEIRLLIGIKCRIRNSPPSLRLKVNLPSLIDAVHISPTAPKWVAEVVEREIRNYGLHINAIHSTLYSRKLG
ncbi:hypothetical protein [Paludibaculum fermentans]|uniref:hypothetical protein n=1 Tax=Paludibaculum fermentans TaxID=1473598 RepID=UPI003EB8948F